MKPSPVQLLHLAFRKVQVEVDEKVPFDAGKLAPFEAFDFEGVTFINRTGIEELTDETAKAADGHVFQLAFELLVNNDSKDSEKQVVSPYLIDIRVAALVRIPPGAERLGPPRDLAAVNGCAIIWGAIREQLVNLTSRMPCGPAMLPTVHFHDLKEGAIGQKQFEGDSGAQIAAAPKRRSSKKAI